MNIKMICTGAIALSMMSGVALAASSGTSALDKEQMRSFYSDPDMKTMKTGDDFAAAWKAMSPDQQTAMMNGCKDDMAGANQYGDFCSGIGSAAGHGDSPATTGGSSNGGSGNGAENGGSGAGSGSGNGG